MRRIIPCLDVRDGRVVKGVRFTGLRDAGDPAERAARYARDGADEIVLLDVAATPDSRAHAVETVRRVRRELDIPLTVGGGVRQVADAAALLEAGADKVCVNTAAVADPALLERLAAMFGRQCVVLALDAARRLTVGASRSQERPPRLDRGVRPATGAPEPVDSLWEVVVRGGRTRTGMDAVAWAAAATAGGAGEVLLTSWDRDGTRSGYDLALVGAVAGAVDVPVVASGGGATPDHLAAALTAGADAVLAASIFHAGEWTVREVKRALAARGVPVRSDPEAT